MNARLRKMIAVLSTTLMVAVMAMPAPAACACGIAPGSACGCDAVPQATGEVPGCCAGAEAGPVDDCGPSFQSLPCPQGTLDLANDGAVMPDEGPQRFQQRICGLSALADDLAPAAASELGARLRGDRDRPPEDRVPVYLRKASLLI